jgi:F-box/leucine-rich repeat protein 2/20
MPIKQVLEARPDMRLVAEYPSEGRLDIFTNRVDGFVSKNLILKVANFVVVGLCCSYAETCDTDMNSDISLQFSSPTSDGSIFMSTSESSYNSDHGSGNEEGQDAVIYGESSDEDNNMNL